MFLIASIILDESVFPNNLKEEIIVPQLKNRKLKINNLNSYLPVTNIKFFSKRIEKINLND